MMLQNLKLLNYKSFINQELTLSPLTVLSGLNASGKSSVIKAIRIIHQVAIDKNINNMEKYNLKFLRSNLVKEKFYQLIMKIDDSFLDIKINDDSEHGLSLDFQSDNRDYKNNIAYLSADRYGPQDTLPNINVKDFNSIGEYGEYAIAYLDKNAYEKVPKCLLRNPQSDNLRDCVNDWLNIIAPGASLSYINNPISNKYSIYYNGSLPTETGYGLSFSLPVIISLLSFHDEILLLENPEAHLHPKAQSELGQLIAKSVKAGKQIIVETHSDHLVDGIRIAAKKNQIDNNEISIYFFERDDMEKPTNVNKIEVLKNGKLSDWPNNFFDQNMKDKAVLANNK